MVEAAPNTHHTVTVTANGESYTVRCSTASLRSSGHAPSDALTEKRRAMSGFWNELTRFMESTDEWRSLPKAEGGYE